LTNALVETGATIAFDAIGGGKLAGQISPPWSAPQQDAKEYSRYGSAVHKQVYILWRPRYPSDRIEPGVRNDCGASAAGC